MLSWDAFAQAKPHLAQHGQRLLRVDDWTPAGGLAYLATVRQDGGPRLHPISPALIAGHLYAFILTASPKQADLRHDGRYALHSWPYPLDEHSFTDEEFSLRGHAILLKDDTIRHAVAAAIGDDPTSGAVFELRLAYVLHKWRNDGQAVYTRWDAR